MDKKDDSYWKQNLSAKAFEVLRQKGTEPAFSGALLKNEASGMYRCAGCKAELFSSEHKFDSGSGWPSFYNVAQYESVTLMPDSSQGMERIEVACAKCGGHLGHVFDDAVDQPTGKRYCINSCALDFDSVNTSGDSDAS